MRKSFIKNMETTDDEKDTQQSGNFKIFTEGTWKY